MEITFKNESLRKRCTGTKAGIKKWGQRNAELLRRRLDDLEASPALSTMRHLPGKCHELKGDRAGELAVSLDGPYRLIFVPAESPPPEAKGGGLDWERVVAIEILGVENYHD
jgi:plasmid maintenance system killer protein